MQILQKGTGGNNFWVGRDGQQAIAIVDHCMSHGADGTPGTLESVTNYFSNKKSEVSAHFGVAKDGRVWQWVKIANTAWANGQLKNPDLSLAWLADAVAKKINPNRLTVSIEHEGDTNEKMGEEQYQASLALHRFIIAATGIRPDSQHIIKHSQIDSVTRSGCPGPFFPMDRMLADLAKGELLSSNSLIAGVPTNSAFFNFWLAGGGLPIFGLPISAVLPAAGKFNAAVEVQWFERSRFELQPGGSVMLGLVGRESMQRG